MRIKRLELVGFKSCLDRTVLGFPTGVTGIVGPNGCGKSNIVDAIRWVLGEQSAKHLRGQAMGDVIFAGNERFGPLGMAEVTIAFDNEAPAEAWLRDDEAGEFDTSFVSILKDAPEIQVTRRLYRSGESEYLANGKPCRLRDITELFLGTGVGTKAYSIIEQGRVSQIVGAKPEELRLMIEEAAGTTLYRSRKLAAERKIDRTRDNLLRVSDIISELQRQANSLRRQARGAARYKELKEQEESVDRSLSAYRVRRLRDKGAALGADLESASQALEEVRESSSVASRTRDRAKQALKAKADDVEQARRSMYESRGALEKLDQEKDFLGRRVEELGQIVTEARAELAGLEERLTACAKDARLADEERGSISQALATVSERRCVAESELEAFDKKIAALAERSEDLKSDVVAKLSHEAALANERSGLDAHISAAEAREERLAEEGTSLCDKTSTAESGVAAGQAKVDEAIKLVAETRGGKDAAAALLHDVLQRKAEAEEYLSSVREEVAQLSSRLDSLKELHDSLAGYDDSVRAFMGNGGRELTGASAVVADVIDIDRGYERAVAAVLHDKLQRVVVPSPESGIAGASYMRENRMGRAGFVPVSPRHETTEVQVGSGEELLSQHVSPRDGYNEVITSLLDGVVVVDSLAEANRQWGLNGRTVTFVTLDGDVVESSGAVLGGSGKPVDESILTRKAEIARLAQELSDARARARTAQKAVDDAALSADKAGTALEEMDERIHALTVQRVEAEGEAEVCRHALARSKERANSVEAEIGSLREDVGEHRGRLDAIVQELSQCQAARADIEADIGMVAQTRQEAVSARSELASSLETLKVDEARLKERRDSCDQNANTVRAAKAEAETRVAQLRRRLHRDEEDMSHSSARLSHPDLDLHAAKASAEENESRLAAVETLRSTAEAELEQAEGSLESMVDTLEGHREERSRVELLLKESQLERRTLVETVHERLGLTEEQLLGLAPEESIEEEEAKTLLDGLREKIRRLGTVNVAAVTELEEFEGRLSELTTQRDDLERSIEDLRGTIAKLNRLSKKRFKETFDAVNEIFHSTFPRLFRGGTASLVLTDENNLLEAGVEIHVQPPGKKLGNLNLLSGGEKALTAVSLIFSLFLHKPSPFCILDEVDAPLDDANIGRFVNMVGDMTSRSQFVIITHNKKTMSACDTLYGVTMRQPGVSKIVSVDLHSH